MLWLLVIKKVMGQADNTPLCTKHQKNVYKNFAVFFLYDFFFFYIQLILNAKAFEKQRIKN